MRLAALVVALVTCLAARAPAQSGDSLQAALDSDFANPLVRQVCLAATRLSDSTFRIDSLAPQTYVSHCDGYRGTVAFIRDTATVSEANVRYLDLMVLRAVPYFWLVCGMQRPGEVVCEAR